MTETETTKQQAGFRLRGRFYPSVMNERLTDAPLIELVCGVPSHEWRRRYLDELQRTADAENEGKELDNPDEIVSLGWVAIAISREHPTWSRSRVAEFIESLDWNELESVNPAKEVQQQDPPADGTPGEQTTSQSSNESNSGWAAPSETSETQPTSGQSTSPSSAKAPSALVT